MRASVRGIVFMAGAAILVTHASGLGQTGSRSPDSTPPLSDHQLRPPKSARLTSVTFEDGRLSVRAQDSLLEELADEIAAKARVAVILDESVGKQTVSTSFQDLPVDEALRGILKHLDAFFFYGVEKDGLGSLRAVWVYARGRGRTLSPVPAEKWASSAELRKMLADSDPEVRSQAILALIEREGNKAQNDVLEVMKDPDDRVRFRTLDKVVRDRVALPLESLQNLAHQDASPVVRFLALNAMVEQPNVDRQAVKAIAELALNDPDENIQNQARELLDQLESAERPPDQDQGAQEQQQTAQPPQ